MENESTLRDRYAGVLLGTAIGDAMGLPYEGMSAQAMRRRGLPHKRYALLGRTGYVSDDTEQSALVAGALARFPGHGASAVKAFRRSLLGWFLRLPWGIGWGTLRACMRIALGLHRPGVRSAGNGAAMRSAIIGAIFHTDLVERRANSDAFARVTHTDVRAVEGARFVAEVAARAVVADASCDRVGLVADAHAAIQGTEASALTSAVAAAIALAQSDESLDDAADAIGNSGFVLHTVPLATFFFLRLGANPMQAIEATIRAGGDTDTNAAIVGAWVGALHGQAGLPHHLVGRLARGPFGAHHLTQLAESLVYAESGTRSPVPSFSWPVAMIRNLLLFPVALYHGARVLALR